MNRQLRNRVTSILAAIAMFPGAGALAQAPAAGQSAQPAVTAQAPGADRLTPSELEELLGAIALYPDPLLANVLAASVYPDEVAEAAKFIGGGGKPEEVDAKSWEDPVKAVAKIPDAIKMMGEYNDWTVALGQAYLVQAKDVMDVVQSLRKKAQENGALQTSPQQKVVVEQEAIYIKPADPEVIYVPSYSPSVVYVENDNNDEFAAGVIGFGVGVATGLILANNLDCDWHGGCVGYGWHGGGYDGGHNDININGDVNIGNTNNINNIKNTKNTNNIGNRVGNEGNAWAPNRSKAIASQQPSRMNQFKGGATPANRAKVPGGGPALANPGGRPGGSGTQRPIASPTQRPNAQPSQRPAARPAAPSASPRVPPRQPAPSAYSGGRDTSAASKRGNASRSQSSGARSAPARSSGGGARSSGGGRGR